MDKTKITTMKGNSFTRNERYGVYGSDKSKVGKQSGNSYSKNGKGSYHMPIAKKHTAPAT